MVAADIFRKYLGWCPRSRMADAGRSLYTTDFQNGDSTTIHPKPSAGNAPENPWDLRYEHTQRATVIILSVLPVIAILLVTQYLFGPELVVLSVLCLMVFLLAIMAQLTVTITSDTLRIRFGPVGLVRKEWRLADIVSATAVANPWYYGYGLRWTPQGPLYNVSGSHAVEILLLSGKKVRIGTDEPEALVTAIRNATG